MKPSKDFVIECAGKLNWVQHKLFVDYGLRQIKYMFEKDTVMTSEIPKGAVFIGLSQQFGRWTAIDYENEIRYGFFKGQNHEWSEANQFKPDLRYDKLEDFEFIYNTFNLKSFELDDLTYVNSEYLTW